MKAQAFCLDVELAEGTLLLTATNYAGKSLLGAKERRIPLQEIATIKLNGAGSLRRGSLQITEKTKITAVEFTKSQSGGITTLYGKLLIALGAAKGRRENLIEAMQRENGGSGNYIDPQLFPEKAAKAGRWIPYQQEVEVAGKTLQGGLLYVGETLPAENKTGTDPALINPLLKADFINPDKAAKTVPYWPKYQDLTPGARGAYLTWLAEGKQGRRTPISWVFLFFYGLERKILVDGAGPQETEEIRAEITRLLEQHGEHPSFSTYARRLLGVMASNQETYTPGKQPGVGTKTPQARGLLAPAIGYYSKHGQGVPSRWAALWAWHNKNIPLRTPATRNPEEFIDLFMALYEKRWPEGLVVPPSRRMLGAEYYPASSGIRNYRISLGLPDVLDGQGPLSLLAEIAGEATTKLETYSRYLAKNPKARTSAGALMLLPSEILPEKARRLKTIKEISKTANTGAGAQVVDAGKILAIAEDQKITPAVAAGIARLLEAAGIGVEPDPRLGGPLWEHGEKAVVFPVFDEQELSEAYEEASIILHLLAAMGAEPVGLGDALEPGQAARLEAHRLWLDSNERKTESLKTRLKKLDQPTRELLGEVALRAGGGSAAQIDTLVEMFKMLKLDENKIYARIHGGAVKAFDGEKIKGYAIPKKQEQAQKVVLDEKSLKAKQEETKEVAHLLGAIFQEEEEITPVGGLDKGHTELLQILARKEQWERTEVEQICKEIGLMLAGAVERINEETWDKIGDEAIDDEGGTINVNTEIAKEMLA